MTIKAIIIEDQVPAQRVITKYLEDIPEIEVVGLCTNALEATTYLRNQKVDLIFLDIHLPKLTGLDFLNTLNDPPAVIITTAYPEFALQGYEFNVIDYLLKPFSFERFIQAVNKALLPRVITISAVSTEEELKQVFVRSDKAIHKIDIGDILFLQSQGDFLKIICENQKYFVAQTLKHWLAILPTQKFLKIHKSYIVNIEKIETIKDDQVYIKNHSIPIGRSYKEVIDKKIKAAGG